MSEKVASCPVSRIDGQGTKHPCLNEHGHSGDHRYGLAHCPAKGDCNKPCIGSVCLALTCGHVSPIGPSMLCDLAPGHEGMHANRPKRSSWATDEQKHRWAEGATFSPRGNGGTCKNILCPLKEGHEGPCEVAPGGYCADPIKPDYYHGTTVDDFIAEFKLGFRLGSVIKYVARHEHKDKIQDLKKAQWYLAREIEKLEEQQ